MPGLAEIADIVQRNEPLAPFTHLRPGGPAEMLVQPRSRRNCPRSAALASGAAAAARAGSGCNLLVRDEGVPGVVLRLSEPAFTQVQRRGQAGAGGDGGVGVGADLARRPTRPWRGGDAGRHPGTVGGALRGNAGDRAGDIGSSSAMSKCSTAGQTSGPRPRRAALRRPRQATSTTPCCCRSNSPMEPESPDANVKRMRKAWILRKAAQPLSSSSPAGSSTNPRGLSAAALIEQAGW